MFQQCGKRQKTPGIEHEYWYIVIGDKIETRKKNVDPSVEQQIEEQRSSTYENQKEQSVEQVFFSPEKPGNNQVEVQVYSAYNGNQEDKGIKHIDLLHRSWALKYIEEDQQGHTPENKVLPPAVPENHQIG